MKPYNLSRYWDWGSLELELPRLPRLRLSFTRNGRMLGLDLVVGSLFVAPAIYRRRYKDDE